MTNLEPPVRFWDSRVAAVLYAVPTKILTPFLDGTGLEPLSLAGRGIVNATWFDYGASTIGPYREFSLGIIASHHRTLRVASVADLFRGKSGSIGAFIVALPVDSEVARAGGLSIYGLPKTKLAFELDWQPSALHARLSDDDSDGVLSMDIPLRLGIPARVTELLIYSRLGGQLLSTPVSTRWSARIDPMSRPALKLESHRHPVAKLAADLGLATAPAIAVMHGRLDSAELPAPRLLRSC